MFYLCEIDSDDNKGAEEDEVEFKDDAML